MSKAGTRGSNRSQGSMRVSDTSANEAESLVTTCKTVDQRYHSWLVDTIQGHIKTVTDPRLSLQSLPAEVQKSRAAILSAQTRYTAAVLGDTNVTAMNPDTVKQRLEQQKTIEMLVSDLEKLKEALTAAGQKGGSRMSQRASPVSDLKN